MLAAALAVPVATMAAGSLSGCGPSVAPPRGPAPATDPITASFEDLERRSGVRLGVHAVHTGTGRELSHRADERFPVLSLFKVLAVAAMLTRSEPAHLEDRVRYRADDVVENSPVTARRVATGMTVGELCDAAIRFSDNTAGNLLLDDIGGPPAVTAFARSLADPVTRLDRREPELNAAVPGDPRDTTSPRAIAADYRELVLGRRLDDADRDRLHGWMLGNTTSATRVRAGLPPTWRVADKTGAGDYGTVNDVAIAWPPGDSAPTVLALLSAHDDPRAPGSNAVLAAAAGIVAEGLR